MTERLRSNQTSNPLRDTGCSGLLTFEESQIFLEYKYNIQLKNKHYFTQTGILKFYEL